MEYIAAELDDGVEEDEPLSVEEAELIDLVLPILHLLPAEE